MMSEFKAFIMRGNVMDFAIAVLLRRVVLPCHLPLFSSAK